MCALAHRAPTVSGPWWDLRCPCGFSGAEPQVDRAPALLGCCLFQREAPAPPPSGPRRLSLLELHRVQPPGRGWGSYF